MAGRDGAVGAGTGGVGATTGGAGGGAVTQPAARSAATNHGASRHRARANARMRRAMGWILLEALVALVLAIAIVWWTMGPKTRKRPPDDGGAPR